MRCLLVSHFHWDREWYRSFQAYRARLVEAVDRVLDLVGADPSHRFLLDGQVILVEDYLALRPERRAALAAAIAEGRLAIGPWYVQPDAFLPSGESHVRNLLMGRRVGAAFGAVSRAAYVPDSFGHPAQMPQVFAGFGLGPFVYWRGNGDELDALGPRWRWRAPDGSAVDARVLMDGYFDAAFLPDDVDEAARGLAEIGGAQTVEPILLMNGFDHMPPDGHVAAVAARLAERTGWAVRRGLLDDLRDEPAPSLAEYAGALEGGRLANLLPGVWSARLPIKLRSRRLEALLEGWLEPFAGLAFVGGGPDERPALGLAWRTLLECQAHDSIGGCATDDVAVQVEARLADAIELAEQTVERVLGRARVVPASAEQDVDVWNPSPEPRTDVVRVALEDYPALRMPLGRPALPPLTVATLGEAGFTVDGAPARVVPSDDPARARWVPGWQPLDVEFVARDVPPLGSRRYRLRPAAPSPDVADAGREIAAGDVGVRVADDGTLAVRLGERSWDGLAAVEDQGDRGDSYDFDPVDAAEASTPIETTVARRVHASGIATLRVRRRFDVPDALDGDRRTRSASRVPLIVTVEARIAPGVARVDLDVRIENAARDHRVRLRFPTGTPTAEAVLATTFDVARRAPGPRVAERWVHPPTPTFVHQGWVHAGGLTVAAPGLPEAEATADGTIAVTVLRAVGWLARFDLAVRPQPAGPEMPVPGAQLVGTLDARLSLLSGIDPRAARAAELGLRAVLADGPACDATVAVAPSSVVLSALKPADDGDGVVLRLLNPTDDTVEAAVTTRPTFGHAAAVRLDETPDGSRVTLDDGVVRLTVPPHTLRSVRLRR